MNIAFFGSSLVSALWNGAATYYRGILRALDERGHRTTFYEPDAYDRQRHRDIDDPPWAKVQVYPATEEGVLRAIESARFADLVVKASGVGVFDELLEAAVLGLAGPRRTIAFWDVDAPATLARVDADPADPFRELVPRYDLILTYGGGPKVVDAYTSIGARRCVPIYNALDPDSHHPVPRRPEFDCDLSFLGNRLPDREARVEEFFFQVARALPERRFLLGGSGWDDRAGLDNLRWLGHVYTRDHNAFNSTPLAVLNINRDSMAAAGFSPPTRVFEAAGAGACLVCDDWEGLDTFLTPGEEVLPARSGDEVRDVLAGLSRERARAIGERARQRVLAEHTYRRRAELFDEILGVSGPTLAPRPRETPAARTSARPMKICVLGLSITSSWGNGHATTYRALLRALERRGHDILFLERDVPWYAGNRDLPEPTFARAELYSSRADLEARFGAEVAAADLVVVGSFVPEGAAVGDWVLDRARGVTAFYDIDTPVTMAKIEAGTCDYLRSDQIPRYDLYLSFTGGPTLDHLEGQLGSPRARALYCSVDPETYAPDPRELRWDLGYMGTYSADRQLALQRLMLQPARALPGRRFVVAGPMYPPEIAWPDNVSRIEHLPPSEHPGFYNSCRLSLNLTRRDMIAAGWSPSVRLFEAASCAAAIVSDRWPGLESILEPGEEIFIADGAGDIATLVADTSPDELARVGGNARRRILAEHTSAHRAAALEGYVGEVEMTPTLARRSS